MVKSNNQSSNQRKLKPCRLPRESVVPAPQPRSLAAQWRSFLPKEVGTHKIPRSAAFQLTTYTLLYTWLLYLLPFGGILSFFQQGKEHLRAACMSEGRLNLAGGEPWLACKNTFFWPIDQGLKQFQIHAKSTPSSRQFALPLLLPHNSWFLLHSQRKPKNVKNVHCPREVCQHGPQTNSVVRFLILSRSGFWQVWSSKKLHCLT